MQRTVLITGGSGYVGSVTAWLLVQYNYRVIILDIKKPCHSFGYSIIGNAGDVRLVASLCQEYSVNSIIHCAASIEVGQSVKDPQLFYDNNVVVLLNLLQAMKATGVKNIIFSSSAAVYGAASSASLSEEDPCRPVNPYGKTKLVGEYMLQDYAHAYHMRYIILRYFNVAGALPEHGLGECHDPETHIIPLILRAAQERKPFPIFGAQYQTKDGSCVRDYIHVLDIAYAHLKALEHLEQGSPSDTFNIGSGRGISVKELVHIIEENCHLSIPTSIRAGRMGDPAYLVADISKAANILGWQPRYSDINYIIRSAFAYSGLPARQASADRSAFLKE